MAPPIWLPPVNSHDQYIITSDISQTRKPYYDEFHSDSVFVMNLTVTVYYFSELEDLLFTNRRGLLGLSCKYRFVFFEGKECAVKMLDSCFPFPLNKVFWREKHVDQSLRRPTRELLDGKGLVDKFWEFLCRMQEQGVSAGKNYLPFNFEIEKRVMISNRELEGWKSWYDVQKRRDPNFEREFRDAIRRPRTDEELSKERIRKFRATNPSFGELKLLRLHSSWENTCAVCLEELMIGSSVVKLPCPHMFHGDWILEWLKERNTCPLCRYTFPHN